MKKICVIIPCYNEAQRLELEVFREFVGREERFDFCFVNDGSQDNTSEVLRRAVELEPGRFLLVDNTGKGGGRQEWDVVCQFLESLQYRGVSGCRFGHAIGGPVFAGRGDGQETGSVHDDGGPSETLGGQRAKESVSPLFGAGLCDVSFDVISTSRVRFSMWG